MIAASGRREVVPREVDLVGAAVPRDLSVERPRIASLVEAARRAQTVGEESRDDDLVNGVHLVELGLWLGKGP